MASASAAAAAAPPPTVVYPPIKVVFLGDEYIGMSILCRTLLGISSPRDTTTDVVVDVGIPITLRLLQASDDINEAARSQMYIEAKAIVLCFKMTQKNTLDSLEMSWTYEVRQYNRTVPVFVIGLKLDTRDNDYPGIRELAIEVADRINAVKYFSCTSENIAMLKPLFLKSVGLTALMHCLTKTDSPLLRYLLEPANE